MMLGDGTEVIAIVARHPTAAFALPNAEPPRRKLAPTSDQIEAFKLEITLG